MQFPWKFSDNGSDLEWNPSIRAAVCGGLTLLTLLTCGVALHRESVHAEARLNRPINRTELFQPDGSILKKGNDAIPEIALTFDDGPYPESLDLILQALSQANAKATFFVVGRHVEEHPELLRRIAADHHEIGNHTFDHKRLPDLSPEELVTEVNACEDAIRTATGQSPTLFRPPGMKFDHTVLKEIESMGYTTVGWTNACKDFESEAGELDRVTEDELAHRMLSHITDGSILLMHSTRQTAEMLPKVLLDLRARGYRFVTISEMLDHLPSE